MLGASTLWEVPTSVLIWRRALYLVGEHGAVLDRIILPPMGLHNTTPERMITLCISSVVVVCGGVEWGGSGDNDAVIGDG